MPSEKPSSIFLQEVMDIGEQLTLLDEHQGDERMRKALSAADRMRDKFGESAISLASGMTAKFRERTHENPAGLPGKPK